MRKLLNVLYVTSPDGYLSRDGQNVVVRVGEVEKARFPIHILESIVCFTYAGASPALMELCAESGVPLSFISSTGKFLARLTGPTKGNVLLRRRQYRMADDPAESAAIVRNVIAAKTTNSRAVIRRAMSDHADAASDSRLQRALEDLTRIVQRVFDCPDDLEALRGLEGQAANVYFSAFNGLIRNPEPAFRFNTRTRRPPRDPVNALLSFLYTLLRHDVQSALETVGLDPYVGFLHTDRPGRPSLALDLMEELRPYLADRLALTLINRKQVTPKDFISSETGGVVLTDEARKTVLGAWQARKREAIEHPFLDEKIEIGLIPYAQALLLARYVRGDLDGYPPFVWR